MTTKVASWNVNSLKVRRDQMLAWLADRAVDIALLQETKTPDSDFPAAALAEAGWRAAWNGQKTYNGVALVSRLEPADILTELPGHEDPQRRVLAASYGPLRVIDLYVPNGQEVGSDKYAYKLDWLARLRDWLAAELEANPLLLVGGDFNIAPEDRDVHDPIAWHEKILCSTPERAALQALLALGFKDAFRLFEQPEASFSWWDYRQAAFRRNLGLRIDLILTSPALAEKCLSCTIDKEPRRAERPSDHAPVVAEFDVDLIA